MGSNRRCCLKAENLIGTTATADLRPPDSRVSRHHLQVLWRNGGWVARDLRSSNGTWLDGRAISVYADVVIKGGAVITLGGATGPCYQLEDDDPPMLFAVRVSDGTHRPGRSILLLIENGDDTAIVRHGAEGWVLESDAGVSPVWDGEHVLRDLWRVYLPEGGHARTSADRWVELADCELVLRAGLGFEHFVLEVHASDRVLELGSYESWYLLWILAEYKARDDGPDEERGWKDVDQLARAFQKKRTALDQYVTLARQYLARAGVREGDRIIVARPGARRLGVPAHRIRLVQPGTQNASS